jgi:AcrR family transcriptional regulator
MYNPDKYKNKAVRSKPSQNRGKERVRIILAAALELFKEKGIEEATTNEIARRARIPIGSLYRYYPNKDSIIAALTELYVDDLSRIFREVAHNPLLPYLSWDETLLLLVDGWINYSRLNGPFSFLYTERANPRLHEQNRATWTRFIEAFNKVLTARCPCLTVRELSIGFNLSLAAVELGVSDRWRSAAGYDAHHEAVGIVASYLTGACTTHKHQT